MKRKLSKEHKANISKANMGKKWSEEAKAKIKGRIVPNAPKKGCHPSPKTEFKKGNTLWKGKKHTKKTRKKMSLAHKGKTVGGKNGMWQGGTSLIYYPSRFNRQLKEKVRVRDGFKCQLCSVPELECKKILSVHHIDYNKKNCEMNNLIALCQPCNAKVNRNRDFWQEMFSKKKLDEAINAIEKL